MSKVIVIKAWSCMDFTASKPKGKVMIKLSDLKKVCAIGKAELGVYPVARYGVNKKRLKRNRKELFGA